MNTGGAVTEKFYVDSGANHTIYPDSRGAEVFCEAKFDIGTANGPKTMRSDGTGKMMRITSDGNRMPGLGNVVFSKQVKTNLLSVGDICDEGYVCVFDKDCVKTYKETDLSLSGNVFTRGEREKISKLYSLSLSKERERISALNAHTEPFVWCALPESASDSEVTSLLAKSYKKADLSEVDRYHGKLGDVGVKAMKKAIPSLAVPAKHRCGHCIEGKMHKRAHKKCKEGERTKYLPGVCLHTDHSGPYKQSLGGHTYSQVFLDMGSGYVWAKRMKAKTGH